jgi:hypothetical protein
MRDRVMLGLVAALAVAILAAPLSGAHAGETIGAEAPRPSASVCAPWKQAASRTIAELAQARPDVDVLRVSEAIADVRRADRLCALGSLIDACIAYDAVIRGVEHRLQGARTMPPMCRSIATGVPAS